jgi:hypothetical protein
VGYSATIERSERKKRGDSRLIDRVELLVQHYEAAAVKGDGEKWLKEMKERGKIEKKIGK